MQNRVIGLESGSSALMDTPSSCCLSYPDVKFYPDPTNMLLLFLAVASIVLVSAQDDDLRTQLVGFDGCNAQRVDAIRQAWRDSRPVMDVIRDININWNEAAALEYLGPPGYNRPNQAAIQDILRNLGTITGRGVPTPFDWQVHVRCDDWLQDCNFATGKTEAYTTNEDGRNIATINFCDGFFNKPPLSEAMRIGRRSRDPKYKFNLEKYDETTGYIIIHELLHINWVHKSGRYGTNQPVIDFRIRFRDPNSGWKTRDVYRPQRAKILARYREPNSLGGIIARSDENLGLYALAKYVQSQLGAYPHRPVVDTRPSGHPWTESVDSPFLFNKTGGVIANLSMPDDTHLIDLVPEDNSFYDIEEFVPDSDLPADYLSAWNGWTQDGVGFTNLHINNYDSGWISTSAASEPSGKRDVAVKKGDTVGVFDGWVTYWTSQCAGEEATFVWEESYGDVYLEADGYMHDSGGKALWA
ncbi:MAG: hypothetical protein M1840_001723 [Geoglossum simile]|nr:MAG: hypothetical protein M1840_001723 [Geoglossum simile]